MIDVVCAIIEIEGKLLICRRRKGLKNEGKWEFPGGKVNAGEVFEIALKREIKEELGVEIKVGRMMSEIEIEHVFKLHAFECESLGSLIESTDHDRIGWVDKIKVMQYDLIEGDVLLYKNLIENGFLSQGVKTEDVKSKLISVISEVLCLDKKLLIDEAEIESLCILSDFLTNCDDKIKSDFQLKLDRLTSNDISDIYINQMQSNFNIETLFHEPEKNNYTMIKGEDGLFNHQILSVLIVLEIENEFNIAIHDDEAYEIKTIGDIQKTVIKKVNSL